MAQVSVDVDLDDFDTDEIVSYLHSVLSSTRKRYNEKKVNDLKSLIEECSILVELPTNGISIVSLEDKIKMEHIESVFNKYTITQLQFLIP